MMETLRLTQSQRRLLATRIKFASQPPELSLARWTVMQLGGASELTFGEIALLLDLLGYHLLEELRSCPAN